jgi:pyruvate/2-oxoglutarate dehydrogenase complex dihydrolipoamide dehydrogenase (E3) component
VNHCCWSTLQELAKGQMLGGADGFLKLIFHSETLKLLGVHCIGDGATEIIHIGQVHNLNLFYIASQAF